MNPIYSFISTIINEALASGRVKIKFLKNHLIQANILFKEICNQNFKKYIYSDHE